MKLKHIPLSLTTLLLISIPVYGQDTPEAAETAVASMETPSPVLTEEPLPLPLDDVRIFTEVLSLIRNAYVEPIDDRTLLENAIKGMLAGIDPHSTYLDSDSLVSFEESTTGEFGGLGIEIGVEEGLIKIITPMDDSPAARAGIQAGDLVIKLNETPAQDVPITESIDMMRGEPGTDITLTILREGVNEPFDITITREIIKTRSVRFELLEPDYAYMRIAQFAANTGDQVEEALNELHEQNRNLKGIILDLRNNPGGVLQASVKVVDSFISEGLIVYTEGREAQAQMRFEATPENPSQGVPLVVLINQGSASASEIVAGALQDHKRAIILGTPSFGKGSVQTVLPLTNDRAIKLTTALYFTPSGRSIQALGIRPDIEVDRGQVTRIPNSVVAYREADLSGHLENQDEVESPGSATTMMPPPSENEILVRDYQLNEALNLLKGLNVLNQQNFARAHMAESLTTEAEQHNQQ